MSTRMGKVGWVLAIFGLWLGPLLALPAMVLAGWSSRRGDDWRPTVALGVMSCLSSVALATIIISGAFG